MICTATPPLLTLSEYFEKTQIFQNKEKSLAGKKGRYNTGFGLYKTPARRFASVYFIHSVRGM